MPNDGNYCLKCNRDLRSSTDYCPCGGVSRFHQYWIDDAAKEWKQRASAQRSAITRAETEALNLNRLYCLDRIVFEVIRTVRAGEPVTLEMVSAYELRIRQASQQGGERPHPCDRCHDGHEKPCDDCFEDKEKEKVKRTYDEPTTPAGFRTVTKGRAIKGDYGWEPPGKNYTRVTPEEIGMKAEEFIHLVRRKVK